MEHETDMEIVESGESTSLDDTETFENSEENTTVSDEYSQVTEYDTELIVLQRIDTTLNHLDSVCQYGVSLLIVFMLVIILHYAYKFFKIFF